MNANQIRRELAILIGQKQDSCTTEKQKNHAINEARREINLKYGKDWRERDVLRRNPQHIGTDIPDGDEWSDYAQTADDF